MCPPSSTALWIRSASRLDAAADYLARMQVIAEPFDLAKVDVYKQLQRRVANGLTPVMELEAEDGASVSQSIIPCSAPTGKT